MISYEMPKHRLVISRRGMDLLDHGGEHIESAGPGEPKWPLFRELLRQLRETGQRGTRI